MRFWIKTIGTAEVPIPELWVVNSHDLEHLAFPKHRQPDVDPGDGVVLYATGHQRLIGAGFFTGRAEHDPKLLVDNHRWDPDDAARWPYVASWTPKIVVPFASTGPHLTDVGVSTFSIRSQSHISIDEATYRKAVGHLATAAAANGEVYVPAYAGSVSLA